VIARTLLQPGRIRGLPWLVLALSALPAFWYYLVYPGETDPEFPRVVRPVFSTRPPFAYRLAEAGDTIDHIAVYVASAAVVLAAWGWNRQREQRAWIAALALSVAAFWHAATPGPILDGWHGVGWRIVIDPRAPAWLRLGLAGFGVALTLAVVSGLRYCSLGLLWRKAADSGTRALFLATALLLGLRQLSWLDPKPAGYWPRWMYVWALLAWSFALLRLAPPGRPGWPRRMAIPALLVAWLVLDLIGRGLFWYQRPLARLRAVVPGRIYISAMPTYWGLELAQERHHFRTIINLFPEHTAQRSPRVPEEMRFAREHGLNYVASPPDDPTGEEYVARTIALAQDPSCWPVLVHCHASMDRSPAWMGIYRFVVQGWPLGDAIGEIERHRGMRPWASVTLLYNRVLPQLAPERWALDPTAALLKKCAAGTIDPVLQVAAGRRGGGLGDPASRPESLVPER
jgi:protein tyrosine phosphatase (PTP) superfamily phosphohydrolase (DUF442 family)